MLCLLENGKSFTDVLSEMIGDLRETRDKQRFVFPNEESLSSSSTTFRVYGRRY